jgi:hypothetical protein
MAAFWRRLRKGSSSTFRFRKSTQHARIERGRDERKLATLAAAGDEQVLAVELGRSAVTRIENRARSPTA